MPNASGLPPINDFYFRHSPVGLALAILIPAAVLYAVYIYRRQAIALSRRRRVSLTILRAVVYAVMLLMLFAPVVGVTKIIKIPSNVLVLLDVSESMSIQDHRRQSEQLLDAAMALGKMPLADDTDAGESSHLLSADLRAEVGEVARLELAKGILRLPELEVLRTSTVDRQVASYTFGEKLAPAVGQATGPTPWLDAAQATAKSTRLGDSLLEAVERHGGQSITAVLVLSDGASNEGIEALDAAQRLGERSIPVHTIGLGLTQPDDVRIQTVLVSDTVFYKDKVPVRVLIESNGFQGRTAELRLTMDGKPAIGKSIQLTGSSQIEELSFVPDRKGGQAKLEVDITVLPGDIVPDNNHVERSLNIIDDKIKILYVESTPRWEYRYLRGILTRDHRLDVKFLLTEGDPELARADKQYLERFPDKAAETFNYDLVILGDVEADYFKPEQLELIEELVSKQGGSFLMIAGRQHAPKAYRDTPIAKVLPIKIGSGERQLVGSKVHAQPTDKGLQSLIASFSTSEDKTQKIWSFVKPLHRLPQLDGAKPGAVDNVLVTLSDTKPQSEPYPLVVWQRYGTGKSLYVGTDQFWRLRRKHGDEYHARFWKQAIQFLTLSRLLGENKRIRLETDRRNYRAGQQVQIYANVLDESFAPVQQPSYEVLLEAPGQVEPIALTLAAIPGSPGLFQGYYTAENPGSYLVRTVLADRKFSNTAPFEAEDANREMLEIAMQEEKLRKISELSGGQYLTVRDLKKLPELLQAEARETSVTQEESLWDRWYVFAFLMGCLSIEWFIRRRNDAA
jgi:uncharacterized membrane protein